MALLLLTGYVDCISGALDRLLSTDLVPILPREKKERLHHQILAGVHWKPSLSTLSRPTVSAPPCMIHVASIDFNDERQGVFAMTVPARPNVAELVWKAGGSR